MSARGLVWITRAEPGASETAARVEALGRTPLSGPLLHVRPIAAKVDLTGVAALAFTSANGVRAFAALTVDRTLPAYAVGASTASALKASGFSVAGEGEGGVDGLAERLRRAACRIPGRILHPTAREPAGDLRQALQAAGIEAESLVVYETTVSAALPRTVEAALAAAEIDAVLIHSPKAAHALAALTSPNALAGVRLIALSPACLAPLSNLSIQALVAATRPSEAALLALL